MLAYGTPADALDENFEVGESVCIKSMKRFTAAVVATYEKDYLRALTDADIKQLLEENEKSGFPGMLFSLDCMHWRWKNCSAAWAGKNATTQML